MKEKFVLGSRIIKKLLREYETKEKKHHARKVHLVVDATYFGQRGNSTWCVIVFRDPKRKEDLWWSFENIETGYVYRRGRYELERLGYNITSVTGDGFGALNQAFQGIPRQMCHVHMERIVVRGTTKKPVLAAGQVLLSLIKTLHQTDQKTFQRRLLHYTLKYGRFLDQITINSITGKKEYTHRELRRSFYSLVRFFPFLFTYEKNKDIPKTSNSLEGRFSHIKDILKIHRGLSRPLKEKVLTLILLASTIAPTNEKLDEIL